MTVAVLCSVLTVWHCDRVVVSACSSGCVVEGLQKLGKPPAVVGYS